MSGRTLEEFFDSLSPLETFEKEVFLGNEEYSQDLCDFILTLSLIWNDAKNISIFHDTVQKHRPSEEEFQNPSDMPITPEWGEFCGIYIFIEKSMVALIHELFSLIRKSKDILDDPVFQNILRQMHRGCRDSWNTIVEYVNGGANSKTQLGKALLMIRHKITSHYDKGEIFKGYHRKFIEDSWIPYISRGSSMPQQRFYSTGCSPPGHLDCQ